MAEMFCKSTWSKVRAGDVVLMPWASLDYVAEAEVVEVREGRSEKDDRPMILASLHVDDVRFAGWAFHPEAPAYVRSRFS